MTVAGQGQLTDQVIGDHQSFLRHRDFLWLKRATAICAIALLAYALIDVKPRHNGGSWFGYTLGTIGAVLIVWLTALGVRKRRMTPGAWSLKAWTSAHVYLGLALIVIATLHSGFQLGWNVHGLAYFLMLLVIASGVFGVVAYSSLPSALSRNREEMTSLQMLDALAATDRQLRAAAQPLDRRRADVILAALSQGPESGGLRRRLSRTRRDEAMQAAIEALGAGAIVTDPAIVQIEYHLRQRSAQLDRIHRQMHLKAILQIWLYVHVPATFALIAALIAHIISVFFYW